MFRMHCWHPTSANPQVSAAVGRAGKNADQRAQWFAGLERPTCCAWKTRKQCAEMSAMGQTTTCAACFTRIVATLHLSKSQSPEQQAEMSPMWKTPTLLYVSQALSHCGLQTFRSTFANSKTAAGKLHADAVRISLLHVTLSR